MNRPVKQKQPRVISKKITQSAKGEDCTLRIPGVCNFNPKTTVFAHMNGGGMGYKHHDIHGCYACSYCHKWLDLDYIYAPAGEDTTCEQWHALKDSEFLRAMIETQTKLLQKGLIKV